MMTTESPSETFTPWSRMLESDYNYRFYLRAALRYRRWATILNGIIGVGATGAVVTVLGDFTRWGPALLSAITAITAVCANVLDPAAQAARYREQAKRWLSLKHRWESLHDRDERGELVSDHERMALANEFSHLSSEEQEYPSLKLQERLYGEAIRANDRYLAEIPT